MVVENEASTSEYSEGWNDARKQYYEKPDSEEADEISAATLLSSLKAVSEEILPALKDAREAAEVELTEFMEKLACENRELMTLVAESFERVRELHKEFSELKVRYSEYCSAKIPKAPPAETLPQDLSSRYGYVSSQVETARSSRWDSSHAAAEDEFKPRWSQKESPPDTQSWKKKDSWYDQKDKESSQDKDWGYNKKKDWSSGKSTDNYSDSKNWSQNYDKDSYDRPDSRNSYKTESHWSEWSYDKGASRNEDSWPSKTDKWGTSHAPARTYTKLPAAEIDQDIPAHVKSRLAPKTAPTPPSSRLYNSSSWGASGSFS